MALFIITPLNRMKKDEFRINGKTHSASEVQQLLETAGFSSANPYYIVQQGKIQLLTMMKDNERIALIKEVAGIEASKSSMRMLGRRA